MADGVAPKNISFEASPANAPHCLTVTIRLDPRTHELRQIAASKNLIDGQDGFLNCVNHLVRRNKFRGMHHINTASFRIQGLPRHVRTARGSDDIAAPNCDYTKRFAV